MGRPKNSKNKNVKEKVKLVPKNKEQGKISTETLEFIHDSLPEIVEEVPQKHQDLHVAFLEPNLTVKEIQEVQENKNVEVVEIKKEYSKYINYSRDSQLVKNKDGKNVLLSFGQADYFFENPNPQYFKEI